MAGRLRHWSPRNQRPSSMHLSDVPRVPRPKRETWRLVGLLGKWHWVSAQKAFRFYIRVNSPLMERWYFADYRCDDLVSRHHKIEKMGEQGPEPAWKKANTVCLDMTREKLAELED